MSTLIVNPRYNVDPSTLTEDEARAVLSPKCEYTEDQHTVAKLRYLLERLHDDIFDVHYYGFHRVDANGWTAEKLKERVTNIAYACDAGGGDLELEDALVEHYGLNMAELRREAEGGMHNGDCTASCFTCMRCWADRCYGVDTSPPNKSIGNALLYRIINLRKQREQNESSATTDTGTN